MEKVTGETYFEKLANVAYDKLDPTHSGKITKEALKMFSVKYKIPEEANEEFEKYLLYGRDHANRGDADELMAILGCIVYADKDDDGVISLAEAIAFFNEMQGHIKVGIKSEEDVKKEFEKFDKENTGKIQSFELIAMGKPNLKNGIPKSKIKKQASNEEKIAFINKMADLGFDTLDNNHDGKVTKEEISEICAKMNLPKEAKEELLAIFEKDKNFFSKGEMKLPMTIFGTFFSVDKNKDYMIEYDEAYDFVKQVNPYVSLSHKSFAEVQEMIKKADQNKDGKLDFVEFIDLCNFKEKLCVLFKHIDIPK